jgi:uncharacterized coiled-coil DUF342 family protein
MCNRAELEKKIKELASTMRFFSNKRENALTQMKRLKDELSSIDETIDILTKEFLELVDLLAKTKN